MSHHHPFSDIRDGPTGGTAGLERALRLYRAAVPSAAEVLASGPEAVARWEAWQVLSQRLEKILAEAGGALSFVAQAGAERGAALAPLLRPGELELPPLRELAARWAERHGAQLVTRETEKTRTAIRRLVASATRGDVTAREVPRLIVGIRGFDLDAQRLRVLENRVTRWRNEDGMTRRNLVRRARKERKRLALQRAKVIWQYEKRSAIWEGARQGWVGLQTIGQLPQTAGIYWRHTGHATGHPCPECSSLIGRRVDISENFVGRPIASGRRAGEVLTVRRPPLHSHCDCWLEVT